jgi:hypothetical protein
MTHPLCQAICREDEIGAMSHALFIINHEKVKIVTYTML